MTPPLDREEKWQTQKKKKFLKIYVLEYQEPWLMDRALRHGHGRVLSQRRAGPVQPRTKAMNAGTVELAGIEIHRMWLMENIKKIIYCRFCEQLTVEEVEVINDKSIDEVSSTEECEDCKDWKWRILLDVRQIAARQNVLLTKAPSAKPQAPCNKL